MVSVGCGCFLGQRDLHWAFGQRWFPSLPRAAPRKKAPQPAPAKLPSMAVGRVDTANGNVPVELPRVEEHLVNEENDCPESPRSYKALRKNFPDSPRHELARFAVGWPKPPAAVQAYEEHLEWRKMSHVQELLKARDEVAEWISKGTFLGKDGSPVILMQIARTDGQIPAEVYFKALCCSIDEQISQVEKEFQRVTVLLDVRGGEGWPNPKPHELLPLLRISTRQLPLHYPGVLHRIILYPVPVAAALFTRMALAFVDSSTRSRISIITERCKGGFEKHLEEYVSRDSLPSYAWDRHPNLK